MLISENERAMLVSVSGLYAAGDSLVRNVTHQTSSGQDEENQFQSPKAQTRCVSQSLLPFGFLAV